MPFPFVPFEPENNRQAVIKKFSIQSIPKLLILDNTGRVITDKGVECVYRDPTAKMWPWKAGNLPAAELGFTYSRIFMWMVFFGFLFMLYNRQMFF